MHGEIAACSTCQLKLVYYNLIFGNIMNKITYIDFIAKHSSNKYSQYLHLAISIFFKLYTHILLTKESNYKLTVGQ